MSKAWVLWHRYSDGSGATIVRVYLDENRAQQDYELLASGVGTTANEWHLDEVEVFGSHA